MIIRHKICATLLVAGLLVWTESGSAVQTGTIVASGLRMRSGPGKNYRVVSHLRKGARVLILADQGHWLKISHDSHQGFILDRTAFIERNASQKKRKKNRSTHRLKDSTNSAETIKGQLHRAQSELAAFTRRENEILVSFNTADEALNTARRQVRAAKNGLANVQNEINDVRKRSIKLESEILEGERYAAKRLVALYKLEWLGKIHLLATAESFFDFVQRKEALEKIISRDEALLEALNSDKKILASLLTRLNTRKAEKRVLKVTLRERIAQLSAQQKRRKDLLQTIRGKKSLELAAIEALKQASKKLDATIEQIQPATPKQAPIKQHKRDAKAFEDYKGLLSWPVKGKVISFFGPYRDKKFAVTSFQSGINIQAERGEPIRSVLNGHVIFSNWFKGFGNMMIVDHGNHYYTVYAHLEEVFKVKGDRVDRNEVIATVGDSGSMTGPSLHFEVRHHGKPVDPLKWIQKG